MMKPQEPPFNLRMFLLKILVAAALISVVVLNVDALTPLLPQAPNPVLAQPTEETGATLVVKAEADAQVREADPDANAGASPDLEVVRANGQSVESYMRFTVQEVPGVIQSARLQVYSTTNTSENGPGLYAVDNNWDEGQITWNSHPARLNKKPVNQDLIPRYSWIEYDVTSLVTGEGTYSFVLAGDSDEALRFSSRESSNGPQLVITYSSATATAAAPATETPDKGEGESSQRTVPAEADASVSQDAPGANEGTATELLSGAGHMPFIRFTVDGITGLNHRVTLRLFATRGSTERAVVRFADSDWTESGAQGTTWESQPTLLSGPVGNPSGIAEGKWVEYDVSAVVTRDGTYTFALVVEGDEQVTFSSREGSMAPELVISPGSIPLTPTPRPTLPASSDVILVGAGDIATCDREQDEMTAALLDTIPGTIMALGDNAYVSGTYTEYLNCYEPTWGRHKDRTKPVPGNHEYNTEGAAGYFQYFDNIPEYYAYTLGAWRIYALNSEIDSSLSSPQMIWLVQDLAANPSQCVLAYWHTPRWSSGTNNGSDPTTNALWQILYEAGAELVVNGHEHNYERFAEMDGSGLKTSPGMRSIVVGTGGAGLYDLGTPLETSEVRSSETFGVLKLTLHESSYDWEFIPVGSSTFADSGSSTCH